MIVFRSLAFSRTGRTLVEQADARIHPGQKLGLVGANGCGKSSLLALMWGELLPDQGDCDIPAAWTRARVEQHIVDTERPAIEFVLDGDAELRRIEQALVAAETAHDGNAIGHLHEDMHRIDGYAARARASALLHGLGFADDSFARPVGEFSGGWRMRLALGRALMCRSDLLLLDEPTNHLDLDAIVWLEQWLQAYRGTLVVISHDRDFLDRVVERIGHIDQRRFTLYTGNYSSFETARAERLAQQQQAFEAQQREIARLSAFVDRFRAKATKARQAQSRVKALARMEKVVAAQVDSPFHFRFLDAPAMSDPLMELERVSAGYGDTAVVGNINLRLTRGARIGLLGRNGAGKSTLVRTLAGEQPELAGDIRRSRHLRVGYFAQHQMDRLRPQDSPLTHLARIAGDTREQDLRDYLGGFDFRGAVADTACATFSGGEKARLALALIIWQRPNLLLLDEPTNHLDLDMREALTLALQDFDGAMLLVSHDRHLISTCCDELWRIHDGACDPFDGDLDDYREWLLAQVGAGAANADTTRSQKREQRELAQAERQNLLAKRRPLLKESEQLEKRLQTLEGEKTLLEDRLGDPALYSTPDSPLMQTLLKRQGEVSRELDTVEARWLAVQEALEGLGGTEG